MNQPASSGVPRPPPEVAPLLSLIGQAQMPRRPAQRISAAPEIRSVTLPLAGPQGPLSGGTLGDFAIGHLLGSGGMGEVYLARQISVDRLIALKVLPRSALADPIRRTRFANEARAAALLDSPHVVRVHATSQHDDLVAIAMELVDGGSLADLLAQRRAIERPPAVAETASLIRQAARGLIAVHGQQLVHRDMKPGNLLLTRDGVLKLGDFGLVKFLDSDALTLTGSTLGTPLYMSPEQGRGKPLTAQSDLYSLGVVLYELLTLRLPFEGVSFDEVVFNHNYTEPVLPITLNPEVPAALQAICLKCLQKNPVRRFTDAAALVADLDRFMAGQDLVSAQFSPGRIGTGAKDALQQQTGRRWLGPVIAGGVALAIAGGWWWWDARKDTVQGLRSRLAPLAVATAIPTTAAADLVALSSYVGTKDPQVGQARARLAEAEALRTALATRFASSAPLTAAELVVSRGESERLARFTPAEPQLVVWRQRLEVEQAQIDAQVTEAERLLALAGPLPARAGSRLTDLARQLAERGALPPELDRRIRARAAETSLAVSQVAERLAILDQPHPLTPTTGEDLDRFELLAGVADARGTAWRLRYERIRELQGRLVGLDQGSLYPAAGADLAALMELVGGEDPAVARWSAKLATIARLRAQLSASLDVVATIPVSAAADLREFTTLVGANDTDQRRWQAKLAAWSACVAIFDRVTAGWVGNPELLAEGRLQLDAARALVGERDPAVIAWTQRLRALSGPNPPTWAAAHGRDRYGAWIEVRVGSEIQRLRWLPPGRFTMGSPVDEIGRNDDETQVEVQLTRGCWIAATECTQALWQEITGTNPSRGRDPQRPVEQVTQAEAEDFCRRFALKIPGCRPRLPSEAEWECAARAGTSGAWCGLPAEQIVGAIAHAGSRLDDPAPTGGRAMNAIGLHDCLGNVWEWCAGAYGPPYAGALVIDPAPRAGQLGVVRGGSWGDPLTTCRVASRIAVEPGIRSPYLGFRFVIDADD